MIKVDLQEKSFAGSVILKGIRLEVAAGECLAVLGPSGIGKTTLLRIAAGLDRQFSGTAHASAPRSMVFQEPHLLLWRTAAQNISLVHPEVDVEHALDRVGLTHRADHFPGQLSLGQQRRLALARAFAGRPKALFLDEPFVSLDAKLADEMMTLTEDLVKEHRPAVLFVTHETGEANRLATQQAFLSGQPATLKGE